MSDYESEIGNLFTAELQFRLASAVRIAVRAERQPLDLPMEWAHGRHHVRYEEIALRQDQADYAASFLYRSATYLMAVAMIPIPSRTFYQQGDLVLEKVGDLPADASMVAEKLLDGGVDLGGGHVLHERGEDDK